VTRQAMHLSMSVVDEAIARNTLVAGARNLMLETGISADAPAEEIPERCVFLALLTGFVFCLLLL